MVVGLDLCLLLAIDPFCDLNDANVGLDVGCVSNFLGSSVLCLGYLGSSLEDFFCVAVPSIEFLK